MPLLVLVGKTWLKEGREIETSNLDNIVIYHHDCTPLAHLTTARPFAFL